VVEQRHRAGSGQKPDDLHDDRRGCLGGALVVAALQRVLNLQPELGAEPVQPDGFLFAGSDRREALDERGDVGVPVGFPGVGVGVAERQRRARP